MHDQLRLTIQKTFNVSIELAGRLLLELIQCVKRKNLVSLQKNAHSMHQKKYEIQISVSLKVFGKVEISFFFVFHSFLERKLSYISLLLQKGLFFFFVYALTSCFLKRYKWI